MSDPVREQVLALAAMFQGLGEIRRIAREGRGSEQEIATCLSGLLTPFDGDIGAAYGGAVRLLPGLRRLHGQLTDPSEAELTRYAVVLMHLERKLMKRRAMLSQLAEGLDQARRQAEHFHPTHDNVVAGLGGLYADTVSTLRPRVMVQGERQWLEDDRNANRIRALLLAGVRATTFWRQAGGSRLRLVFGRNRLLRATDRLTRELPAGGDGAAARDD